MIRVVRIGTVMLSMPAGLRPSIMAAAIPQVNASIRTSNIVKVGDPPLANQSKKMKQKIAPNKVAMKTTKEPSMLRVDFPIV